MVIFCYYDLMTINSYKFMSLLEFKLKCHCHIQIISISVFSLVHINTFRLDTLRDVFHARRSDTATTNLITNPGRNPKHPVLLFIFL